MLNLAPGSFGLINTELQMTQTDLFVQPLTDDCTNDTDKGCTLSKSADDTKLYEW